MHPSTRVIALQNHLKHTTVYTAFLQHFQPSINKPTLRAMALLQQIPFHPPSCTSQEEIVFGYQLYTTPTTDGCA
jgi:hypothetical protein